MSRRNRTNRRRTYGKRQHEVRERRPADAASADWPTRDEGLAAPEANDGGRHHDTGFDGWEGYAR